MKTSNDGLARIAIREGIRNEAYLDTKGIPTIGIGHTGGVKIGDTATDEQVVEWLQEDVSRAEDAINYNTSVELSQTQFDALVSFVFNVGVHAFLESTLRRKLNAGDYAGAADAFDNWHLPREIIGRRDSEKAQFLE